VTLRGVPEGDEATRRRHRYVDATGRTLALLGVLFVMAYTVYVLWPDRPQGVTTAVFAILILTWLIFVIDVVIRIALTPHGRRWHYAWHHPLEVLSAILPVFRALRVVGLLQNLPVLKRHTPSAVRAQFIILALAYACAWVFFLSLATLEAERDAPGANITTFGDSIWWALVTIATVGYGDTYPVTSLGRFYAVLLMAGGVAIVGTASATIISFLNERMAGLRHHGDTLAAPPSLASGDEPDSADADAAAAVQAAADLQAEADLEAEAEADADLEAKAKAKAKAQAADVDDARPIGPAG
jgi:voltage-gated potassium channel